MTTFKARKTSLYRYTNLPSLLHVLKHKQLTLLDPENWDDKNDAFSMLEYKRKTNVQTVLALCFTLQRDTYHHWNIFSGGDSGVRIELDKEKIISSVQKRKNFECGAIDYKKMTDVPKGGFQVDELPFIKRIPYEPEKEFRIIYTHNQIEFFAKEFPIKLKWIKRITISPWMPLPLYTSVRETIKSIDGCSEIDVYRSTVIDNSRWKKAAQKAK